MLTRTPDRRSCKQEQLAGLSQVAMAHAQQAAINGTKTELEGFPKRRFLALGPRDEHQPLRASNFAQIAP
eukprot:6200289-Pleurochrysis_carterae.AAC.3